MAKQSYEVGEGGQEWATTLVGHPVEPGDTVELEVEDDTALVAAGWLVPVKAKGVKG